MQHISLQATSITKTFNRRNVFSNINFSVAQSKALAIVGRNGSGKSTLVKIIAGVLSPTSGEVTISINGNSIKHQEVFQHIGFVAPYLQLYDEFTAYENLTLYRRLRGGNCTDDRVNELLRKINLYHRKDDIVRTFSSGMKQRLKYAFALLHQPAILLLDEPTTNLDSEGIEFVYTTIDDQRKRGLVIVASNDREDTEHCDTVVDLNSLAKSSGKEKV